MKKILVIGDVHGRNEWSQILEENPDYDRVVFMGDYFDSWDLSAEIQMDNFKDICRMKDISPDKIILLYGNHDLHYLLQGEKYSGYQGVFASQIKDLLEDNEDKLQWAYEEDLFLFTHAGVSNEWCKNHSVNRSMPVDDINQQPLSSFGFKNCRPFSLLQDHIGGFKQVVGHTEKKEIECVYPNNIWFVDVPGSYITIVDGDVVKNQLKSYD